MFSHGMVGADEIGPARRFYDATLGTLGIGEGRINERGMLFYGHRGDRFGVIRPIDGEPAHRANGGAIRFLAPTPEAVEAWQAAGVAHGGTAIEDAPGPRDVPGGRRLYLACLRDPAGNKLRATCPL